MQDSALLDELRRLETALHGPEVRADRARLGALLDDQFWEIGRSGMVWTREAALAKFDGAPQSYTVWSQDFKVEMLASALALLTYRSAHITQAGELERHTHRASLWEKTDGHWRMRFHQGTPTQPFEKHAI
jgi:hypothetical protein